MPTKGLRKATNYWNRVAAWDDWEAQRLIAMQLGFLDLIDEHKPPKDASWRVMNKSIASLRNAIKQRQQQR